MDLRAIAETKLANELRDLYSELFVVRYKTTPYFEDSDSQVFDWLATKFPKQRSISIVRHYFQLTDRFIVEKAFPVRLMKSQINQVLAAVGSREASKAPSGMALKINLSCDRCVQYYDWVGQVGQLEPKIERICPSCIIKPTVELKESQPI